MTLKKVHPGKIYLWENLTVAFATVATVWIRPWLLGILLIQVTQVTQLPEQYKQSFDVSSEGPWLGR
jgi:cell division protein FtsX